MTDTNTADAEAKRPDDDWFPCETEEPGIWGPWIKHDGGERPEGIRTDLDGGRVDTVIYATKNGGGWGRNWSPFWPDILWYRTLKTHKFYQEGRHRHKALASQPRDDVRELREALERIRDGKYSPNIYDPWAEAKKALSQTDDQPPLADENARLREALADLTDAFLSRHGCFPLDRTTDEQKHWHRAMKQAYAIVGQPNTRNRDQALATYTGKA